MRNRRPPHTTGEPWPIPGSDCRQRILLSLHVVGMPVASLCPAPFGPRKRSQLSAHSAQTANTTISQEKNISRRGAEAQRKCIGRIEFSNDDGLCFISFFP